MNAKGQQLDEEKGVERLSGVGGGVQQRRLSGSRRLSGGNKAKPSVTNANDEFKEDDIPLSIWWKVTYLISFIMGIISLLLYFAVPHLSRGMSLLVLLFSLPSVAFASGDGYGWANDMVEKQYGAKRAIQVNVATGNGTELISALTAFAQGSPLLAYNIIFSGMIINGLLVPSFAVLSSIYRGQRKFVENSEEVSSQDDFLGLQGQQTLVVILIVFFLQKYLNTTPFTVANYLFYVWAFYSYLSKTWLNIMATDDEEINEPKTPLKIAAIYTVCTIWIVTLSYVGTGVVNASANDIGISSGFFSVLFALEGAIPELYKSIIECTEDGTYHTPRAVSSESNAQLAGFVLPVIAIIGSNGIMQLPQANIIVSPTTAAFYALSTVLCYFLDSRKKIEVS